MPLNRLVESRGCMSTNYWWGKKSYRYRALSWLVATGPHVLVLFNREPFTAKVAANPSWAPLLTAYIVKLTKSIRVTWQASQLFSHDAPFNCVLIDNHFPKHGEGFFRMSSWHDMSGPHYPDSVFIESANRQKLGLGTGVSTYLSTSGST